MAKLKNKSVLISGAGVGGLALAYWLQQYGFHVTVVEKASGIRNAGYRVDIRGAAVEVARQMDILNSIKEAGTTMRGSSLINSKGKSLVTLNNPDIFGMRAPGDVEIMRGDLTDILYQTTQTGTGYLFDDTITGIYQSPEGIDVIFNNSEPRTFYIVVGADGLHSRVRDLVFGSEHIYTKNLGYYAAAFSLPDSFGLDEWEQSYPSAGKIINLYNTGKGQPAKAFLMFASSPLKYHYQDIDQQKKIVTEHFKAAGWRMPEVLKAMAGAGDFYFDSISQVHMERLSRDRIVLLGDAGYCASPASGQGTSLALVGAYVLAGELAAMGGDYETAYLNYEQQMRPFIQKNQQLGITVLKELVPESKRQIMFQTFIMRLMLHLPGKEKIFKSILKETQEAVNIAANGIELKDYPSVLNLLRVV
jgi:2-polyprenyl-6-methoxyphenol hydroxylase-like FAD-dependent oxidoreductase